MAWNNFTTMLLTHQKVIQKTQCNHVFSPEYLSAPQYLEWGSLHANPLRHKAEALYDIQNMLY